MSGNAPFEMIRGVPLDIWLGPVAEAIPDVDNTPAGNFVTIGKTDGDQTLDVQGPNTYWSDNTQQGDTAAVRPHEMVICTFTLIDLTLENQARIMDSVSDVTTDAGPPSVRQMPLQRGGVPANYVMLMRSLTASPYGAFPAMYVLPIGTFDSIEPLTFGQDQRAEFAVEFHVMADPTQAAGDEMGYLIAQDA